MSPVHYRPAYEEEGVVCGATPLDLEFTRVFGMVTCFACRKHPTFRLDQLGLDKPPTDVRPSDRAKLRQIKQVLAEWEHNAHTEANAMSIIAGIVNKEGPSDG